jgi:hypothetical protein
MTGPQQTGPATTSPAALIAYYQWEQSRATLMQQLCQGAADIAPRLDETVAVHRTSSDTDLTGNRDATANWDAYLSDLYAAVEADWTTLNGQIVSFTQAEINYAVALRQQYQSALASLQLVLIGLNLFFWNVINERDELRQASQQASYQADRDGDDGHNASPLPSNWLNSTPLQSVDGSTLGTVIVTRQGQVQNVNMLATDVTAVRQLATYAS